jgi:hypothetical protein
MASFRWRAFSAALQWPIIEIPPDNHVIKTDGIAMDYITSIAQESHRK